MTVKTEATIDDLYRVKGKAEIVDGELILMSPTGDVPGHASFVIAMSLHDHARRTGVGRAVPDNVAFVVDLPNRKSFSPDAAYYIGPSAGMKFIQGAPLFAAEVRSENDYGRKAEQSIVQKRTDYFAAGTLVVWDVDLLSEDVVRVYRADNPVTPAIYRRGERAEAEPALIGWSMPVDDLCMRRGFLDANNLRRRNYWRGT